MSKQLCITCDSCGTYLLGKPVLNYDYSPTTIAIDAENKGWVVDCGSNQNKDYCLKCVEKNNHLEIGINHCTETTLKTCVVLEDEPHLYVADLKEAWEVYYYNDDRYGYSYWFKDESNAKKCEIHLRKTGSTPKSYN